MLVSTASPQLSKQEAVEEAKRIVRRVHPTPVFDYYWIARAPPAHSDFRVQFGEVAPVFVTLSADGDLLGYEDLTWSDVVPSEAAKLSTDEDVWRALGSLLSRVPLPPIPSQKVLARGETFVDEFSITFQPSRQLGQGVESVDGAMLKDGSRIVSLIIHRSSNEPDTATRGRQGNEVRNTPASVGSPALLLRSFTVGGALVVVITAGAMLIRRARHRS